MSHGIVNEVYYPRLDQANIRDLGLIVTDGRDFFSEEKRDCSTSIEAVGPGVPAYRVVNVCKAARYRIRKTILTDPRRSCLLQKIRFEANSEEPSAYQLFALLAPHLVNRGAGNDGWLGEHKGWPMLFAQYGEHADGAPFDGTGIGRGWPLLGGERAHYELALRRCPLQLLRQVLSIHPTIPKSSIP
jgi:glucoamylase